MSEQSLIVATQAQLPVFQINESTKLAKAKALETAALIGKVVDQDSKIIAVRAQQELKSVLSGIEKARKTLKEPLLQAGRQLDTLCAAESKELEMEFGRVSNCVKEFDDQERRRVLEEERLQREELERIEREKQAELDRIAREQAEVERKAREAQEAAAKAAAEATNKSQREAAAKAQAEAQRLASEAQAAAQAAAAKTEAIEEKAGDAAYAAGKPIEITRVAGQRSVCNWVITVEQPFILAKFHPDLVDIKPRIADIKSALNEGREIKGIKAVRETTASVRLPKPIDV